MHVICRQFVRLGDKEPDIGLYRPFMFVSLNVCAKLARTSIIV